MNKPERRLLQGLTAEEQVVRDLLDRLIAAFEELVNTWPEEVGLMEGFMAAHNFHKAIVLDVVERIAEGLGPDHRRLILQMAKDTFSEAMEREIARVPLDGSGRKPS